MASANPNIAVANEWTLAKPWLWLGIGLAITFWSWLWTLTYGGNASDYRVVVLAVGLLATGVGLWQRWRDRSSIYLDGVRGPLMLLLGLLFGLLGLGVVVLFALTIIAPDRVAAKTAGIFLVAVTTLPPLFFAAQRRLNRELGNAEGRAIEEEIALAFAATAGICLLGSATLDADANLPNDWATLRLFLRVACAVCLYASTITLVTKALRRIMLSVLFCIHFAGITTAVLSAHPAPWIMQQMWMRFFRPYLEFVYLNNAYHFYAPEPSASSYLWFRVIYETPDGDHGLWYKVPGLDDDGNIQHPVALEYQRFLSMTEAVAQPQAPPSENEFDPKKNNFEMRPFYRNRISVLPGNQKIGEEAPHVDWVIPFSPDLPPGQQVFWPNHPARQMLASFARFVARKYQVPPEADTDPDKASWKFKSVKVYRVIHFIPTVQWFQNQISPTDPGLYRAFFVGNFDVDGKLIKDNDPYLYWLLPVLREKANDPDSKILDLARLHAGDRKWIRPEGSTQWREATPEEEKIFKPQRK